MASDELGWRLLDFRQDSSWFVCWAGVSGVWQAGPNCARRSVPSCNCVLDKLPSSGDRLSCARIAFGRYHSDYRRISWDRLAREDYHNQIERVKLSRIS